jgi:hypothetical protein
MGSEQLGDLTVYPWACDTCCSVEILTVALTVDCRGHASVCMCRALGVSGHVHVQPRMFFGAWLLQGY